MTDNEKTGELMPCPMFGCGHNRIEFIYEGGPMLHGVRCVSPEHVLTVYGPTKERAIERWNTRAPQSPPVQSDAELQGAIAWMREKHKAGELPHGATWYLNKIIEAAEQRVAPQTVEVVTVEQAKNLVMGEFVKSHYFILDSAALSVIRALKDIYPNGLKIIAAKDGQL